jgi:hypothetical protein
MVGDVWGADMPYVAERITLIGTDANGRTLWRVRTNEGVVTEAVFNANGVCQEILPAKVEVEKEAT